MKKQEVFSRRGFLSGAAQAGMIASAVQGQTSSAIPIVDCHIHLFDQTRPQGAPYSGGKSNTVPALPARYKKLASPLGIVAAIELDASNWVEDNLWVLETIQPEPLMVGTVGNLQPEKPDFREFLDRLHKNPLFLGFRYGNVWGYDLGKQIGNPVFIDGMRATAEAGLVMDSANPSADLVTSLLRLKDKVPDLRLVLDHTGHLAPGPHSPVIGAARGQMEKELHDLARRPGCYFKLSEILQVDASGKPVLDRPVYRPQLDYLMAIFGEDRVLFGSDWPNGEAVNHLDAIVQIVQEYFATKSQAVQEKYFWRNSLPAYRWKTRALNQPQP